MSSLSNDCWSFFLCHVAIYGSEKVAAIGWANVDQLESSAVERAEIRSEKEVVSKWRTEQEKEFRCVPPSLACSPETSTQAVSGSSFVARARAKQGRVCSTTFVWSFSLSVSQSRAARPKSAAVPGHVHHRRSGAARTSSSHTTSQPNSCFSNRE